MIPCEKCGANTRPKSFNSKQGKRISVLECMGNCQNDKGYPYTFFPPKQEEKQPVRNQATPQANGESIQRLRSIDISLKNIEAILRKQTGQIEIQPEELQPDSDVPF